MACELQADVRHKCSHGGSKIYVRGCWGCPTHHSSLYPGAQSQQPDPPTAGTRVPPLWPDSPQSLRMPQHWFFSSEVCTTWCLRRSLGRARPLPTAESLLPHPLLSSLPSLAVSTPHSSFPNRLPSKTAVAKVSSRACCWRPNLRQCLGEHARPENALSSCTLRVRVQRGLKTWPIVGRLKANILNGQSV